jgi:hypothetical protein
MRALSTVRGNFALAFDDAALTSDERARSRAEQTRARRPGSGFASAGPVATPSATPRRVAPARSDGSRVVRLRGDWVAALSELRALEPPWSEAPDAARAALRDRRARRRSSLASPTLRRSPDRSREAPGLRAIACSPTGLCAHQTIRIAFMPLRVARAT